MATAEPASPPTPVPSPQGGGEQEALFETALRLGDNALVLGQRLTSWISRAPTLELDIALANYSLDLIGQARLWLDFAGRIEGAGRDEDALAMGRRAHEFRNVQLVELPNGDFARTMLRQFLFAGFARRLYEGAAGSSDATVAGIAGKAVKEMAYHARHAGEWVVRLGDGTDESHERAACALDDLWPYTHELFMADHFDRAMAAAGILPDPAGLREPWLGEVNEVLERATLSRPADGWRPEGGRRGVHTEHLSYVLAEMQVLPRTYPGATW
ncbi:MAG TPA: 1,2-phenylacetyl-CoA epoxidase subunit PaaC [Aestuariivirgaceae bacterium]|nr:1,2-phenylacetyl-CoA epoxidase subunit PaaC [Aestuariivirgaceae bacterium]